MRQALGFVIVVCLVASALCGDPAHVHLAYAAADDEMQVTFATRTSCNKKAYVVYVDTTTTQIFNATAHETIFTQGNAAGHKYINNALLTGLVSGKLYNYHCVCDGDKSSVFHFNAKISGNNWVPNLLVFGDMGRTLGPQALPGMIDEVKKGWPHAALHNGDFAYDLDILEGLNGDIFMNQIQDVAAYIPYMVGVGNHEPAYNYSHYRNRFNMPNSQDNMYFSWNLGAAHFVAYSTEVYFFENKYPTWTIQKQLAWLEQDLTLANQNRNTTPWVIAYGHRPMYCSNIDGDDCTRNNSIVRAGLETLFYKYGVDIILEAHEHSYERLWPVFNTVVTQNNYKNPKAPVHIITGVAGCNEDYGECVNAIKGPIGPWSAFRASGTSVYGYGKMQIFNATHIYWEQVEVDRDNILDSIWITQDSHGPYL